MIIGIKQKLRISRIVDFGVYLQSGQEEVLLPKKYVLEDSKIGEEIEVFLYHDSEGRVIATTLEPKAQREEIALLKVVGKNEWGCFLDLGIAKDLFMPTKTPHKFNLDSQVLVFITTDRENRLIAKSNIKSFLKSFKEAPKGLYKVSSKVEIVPFRESNLGYECVVDGEYLGLLYKNEIFSQIEINQKIEAFIKRIYPNGKCDLSLKLPMTKKDTTNEAKKVLERLKENGGHLGLHYDSAPQEITEILKMSKKSFKSALTWLLEQDKITLKAKEGIWLKD